MKKHVNYPTKLFLPLAILAALLIVVYNQERSYAILFTSWPFYYALLASTLMALVIIWYIYKITLKLDAQYPWYRNYGKRMKHQLIRGVIIPVLLSFVMASAYFMWYHINIFDTIWFEHYLRQILFLIILLNGLFFYSWHQQHHKRTYRNQFYRSIKVPDLPLSVSEIACVFIMDKHYYWVSLKGEQGIWPFSIKETRMYLSTSLFHFISRSYVINFNAIKEIEVLGPKKTMVVLIDEVESTLKLLKSKYENHVDVSAATYKIKISNNENTAFKRAYLRFHS